MSDSPATTQAASDRAGREQELLLRLLGRRALALGSTPADRLWGWLGPALVALLAAVLRLVDLGYPHKLVFDETYYVKGAYTMARVGYDATWPAESNPSFESGSMDVFETTAAYVVHPPLGKWLIAAGMELGGPQNAWAWRLATAVVGILAVFILARAARRLFSSTALGVVAGGLLAVDGQAIVHSRTGLLDNFVMFWALVAFALLLVDRDRSRRRLAALMAERGPAWTPPPRRLWGWDRVADGGLGPALGIRWWRLAAAVALGLCTGTKWSGLYFLAVFAVLSVLWDAAARRAAGVRRWLPGAALRDALPAAATMLPTALVTYLVTWAGWFLNSGSYMRDWAEKNPGQGVGWLPGPLRSLWEYHVGMWGFHTGVTDEHTYEAHPLGWIIQLRTTSFFYESYARGENGCEADKCSSAITALGNPLLWWAGALCLLLAVVVLLVRRDWRASAVLSGVLAGWVPWLPYAYRTVFTFYSIAFAPFVVLAVVYMIALALERTEHDPRARRAVQWVVGALLAAIVLASVFFYPIWTGMQIPYEHWHDRMWLQSWI